MRPDTCDLEESEHPIIWNAGRILIFVHKNELKLVGLATNYI
jgi:hypothetical protein